ncbi:MAG TPA: hypothetical protein VHD58_10910 [Mycobacteriales bacterium]|nr:hypothetical protein [Mycobacteriales bacterium]
MSAPLPAAADPAETAVSADLADARMRAASDEGRFAVVSFHHPVVLGWVAVGGARLGLRLDVSGYPGAAPAGQPWDLDAGNALDVTRWPVGGRQVFRRDWSPGNGNAPYLAVDRIALASHPNWRVELPGRAWAATMTIYDYLAALHEALGLSSLPG